MTERVANIMISFYLILWCQTQAESWIDANKSFLTITNGCVCPSHTLTLECTVVTRPDQRGSTVWKGSAFDCKTLGDEITLLHSRFPAGVIRKCSNGSIIGQSVGVDNENITYTSQLNVTVSSDIIGQNVTCLYDDFTTEMIFSIDSIELTEKAQFKSSTIMASFDWKQSASFSWSPFSISRCPVTHYNILASNCGSCPTTTNHTNVTCTDLPVDAELCSFILIPTICGSISPNLSASLDINLKESTENKSILIATSVLLTIIIVAGLLILIGIALLIRYKDYIRRAFHFQSFGTSSAVSCTNQIGELKVQHNTSQYEEIGIYSCGDKNSESDGSILKIFDNENKEKGIYGVSDDCELHRIEDTTYVDQVGSLTMDSSKEKFDAYCSDYWLRHHPGEPTWKEMAEAQRKIQLQFKLEDKAADVDAPPPMKK